MTKIGITGGIGSGKSVISHILKIMHYPVYDSDYWAKFLMNNDKTIYKALTDKFGPETYSSEGINRPFLAQLIFNNKENLTFVNSIVHPAVGNHFLQWTEEQQSSIVFIESAILFSSGLNKIIDKTIYVDAPQEIRLQRAILRDNASTEAISARIKNQINGDEYARTHSDYIINNDNTSLLIPQIISILQNL
jgi:dephospho-CoA kinase